MYSDADKADRLRRVNERLHAFVAFCDPDAGSVPAPRPAPSQALAGLTVGVKDIIDVAGLPTRNGSKTCSSAPPAVADAPVVAALRRAGATIVGKTVTTEFAFTDPTDCRNPYDHARSPGGSSSGSGAAVAAGLVDIALGTQTAGSLCRPAAYCGAVGFKPSFGAFSTQGVTPLAPSFDTVGIIARSVDLADRAFHAMRSSGGGPDAKAPAGCIAACALLDTTTDVAAETRAALRDSADALAQISAGVAECQIPLDIVDVVADHRIVMNSEAFGAHGHLLGEEWVAEVGPRFAAGLRAGSAVTARDVAQAKSRLAEAKAAFWTAMSGVDAILTLPVPEGAPLLEGTTGFQDWLTPWTVFGGPLLCLPWGLDSLGRPRSVMLAVQPGQDATLLAVAKALEAKAPDLPRPDLDGA